ncbi:MAG: NHL repeat-containing protein [Gammaproteobacteria bacterium]
MQETFTGDILLACALAVLLAACSDGDGGRSDPPPDPDTQGRLDVNIEPDDTAGARVIVAGPGGVRSVTQDRSLTLDAGDYTIAVVGVRVSQPIVDDVVGVIDKPAVTIAAGQTENVTADYGQSQPGAGRLWYPVRDKGGSSGEIHGFDREQLSIDTVGPGGIAITGLGLEPINTTFDAGGNLWVAAFVDNTLLKYSAEQLAAPGGALVPDVTISADANGSLNGPVGLAFDSRGNLWVGNFRPTGAGANTLVRFTPQQLAQPGQPTPRIKLRGLVRPYGHAFDADGNLWVGNNGADNVLRFPPAQQKNGGTPDVTLTDTSTGALDNPRGPAFNSDGELWVSSAANSQAVGYTLNGAGTATQTVTVNLQNNAGSPVFSPDGLAFDNEGNLWVAASDNNLYKYNVGDLTDGADVQPAITISGFGPSRGVLFSFYPPALDLPLAQ